MFIIYLLHAKIDIVLNENNHKFGAGNKKMKGIILLVLLVGVISIELHASSDSLTKSDSLIAFDYSSPEMKRSCLIDSIIEFASKHIGTPYRYSGCSPSGFDCSGFMNYIHSLFGINMLRSSRDIANEGFEVKFKDIEPGDLVFFKGRKISSNVVGHVGLVIEKTNKSFKMIHASVSNGVRIDDYESAYYQNRFLFAKRLNYPTIDSTVPLIE